MANKPITDKEALAWYFAKDKHHGQLRNFSGKSYFDAHVQKVNGRVKLYTNDEDTLILALLHDVPEDCYKSKWEAYPIIKELFGQKTSNRAMDLAVDKDEVRYKYNGNKGLYLANKMIYTMDDETLEVKLADRFENISDAFTADESFRFKYYNQTTTIIKEVEGKRKFNKVQKELFEDIKAKMENVKKIFKY